ncbi:CRE-SPD-2 protein [Caenorhabditis remanei]|uniref:CRE-SPD-2 protein n=1 Tax=Caenorhabditis remanei TaxID=31234 RepID=E3LVQ8_CAERE|nr:CRE-SPD-2 protein [Caenorhabditis remanei]
MDEEVPMDLVDDQFDDVSIEDAPLEDVESFYNPDGYVDCEEDDVVPTNEHFRAENRYKPSLRTPRELPTIREENREDIRSNTSSRVTTRPPSVLSDKSNDLSSQFGFQSGGNAIDQYTDKFFADDNRAERLFPESELINKFASPARDKQNSWEPSVCHYEKQPTPEVQNNSPGLIFANLSSKKDPFAQRKQDVSRVGKASAEKVNNENEPTSRRISPERNIFTTSPMNSTKFLEEKTSTPKRPGGNRIGQRGLPSLEFSTIYEYSPQRASGTPRNYQTRHPTNPITPNTATTSDTLLSYRTINDSIVAKVLSGDNTDKNLLDALEEIRKKRQNQPSKPNFVLSTKGAKPQFSQQKTSTTQSSVSNKQSTSNSSFNGTSASQSVSNYRKSQESQRNGATTAELNNSNTTNFTSNSSRLSTAKNDRSSRQRGGFSDSSVSTVVPISNSTTTIQNSRGGRDSVSSVRTISRASSTMTVGGSYAQTSSGTMKPLKIHATRIAFGVVPQNETLTIEIEIENISERPCQVRSTIDSAKSEVQILDNKMAMIDPKKSTKLRVAFTPTLIGRYNMFLKVEVPAQNFTQSIPIWGYGGFAKITPFSETDLRPTDNASEFVMKASNMKRITFKLNNSGNRTGFALMTVYDSAMRPVPNDFVNFYPARGVVVHRQCDKRVEVRIDTSYLGHYDELSNHRTSSAMSTASTSSMASCRKRAIPGTDFVVQVAWGEETIRERLRLLEIRTGRHQIIDGQDFTSHQFADEKAAVHPAGCPTIIDEDADLFASSYNTFFINIFPSPSGLKAFQAASVHLPKATNSDVTVLETSAFRQNTFVSDATMMSRQTKRM